MSYKLALETAGAEVLAYQEFGSWQGDWLAKVRFKGQELYIRDYFGSCSGCDAFRAQFDYDDKECDEHRYEPEEVINACLECQKLRKAYQERLVAFGLKYLEDPSDKDALIKKFKEDTEDVLDWLDKN